MFVILVKILEDWIQWSIINSSQSSSEPSISSGPSLVSLVDQIHATATAWAVSVVSANGWLEAFLVKCGSSFNFIVVWQVPHGILAHCTLQWQVQSTTSGCFCPSRNSVCKLFNITLINKLKSLKGLVKLLQLNFWEKHEIYPDKFPWDLIPFQSKPSSPHTAWMCHVSSPPQKTSSARMDPKRTQSDTHPFKKSTPGLVTSQFSGSQYEPCPPASKFCPQKCTNGPWELCCLSSPSTPPSIAHLQEAPKLSSTKSDGKVTRASQNLRTANGQIKSEPLKFIREILQFPRGHAADHMSSALGKTRSSAGFLQCGTPKASVPSAPSSSSKYFP